MNQRIDEQFFTQVKCFHFRITSEVVTKEAVHDHLVNYFGYVIVSQEISKKGKNHIHALLGAFKEDKEDKDIIKFLQKYADDNYATTVLKGNALKSVTNAISNEQLKRYVLKEGNFIYTGFTAEQINNSFIESYTTGRSRYTTLLQKLHKKTITYTVYQNQYIKYKAEDGTINLNQIANHFLAVRVQIGQISTENIVSMVEDKLMI